METEILEDYHGVINILERLMLFIFHGLSKRYGKEPESARRTYVAEPFRLPKEGNIVRIEFTKGIKIARPAKRSGTIATLLVPRKRN
jgi:aspartyl-tRNA synthetase